MTELLRQIIRELRFVYKKGPVHNAPAYSYIVDQFRSYQVTGEKHCKEKDEMRHLAQTYLCLLESNKKQAELSAQYARGERSIEEAAGIVGLALPKPYQPSWSSLLVPCSCCFLFANHVLSCISGIIRPPMATHVTLDCICQSLMVMINIESFWIDTSNFARNICQWKNYIHKKSSTIGWIFDTRNTLMV